MKENEVPALAAQLSYYLILAFFPFLIFLVTLAGYTPLTGEEVLSDLSVLLPENTYRTVIEIVREISVMRSGTLLSFSMLAALWIASNGMYAVIRGINKAYGCRESRPFWKVRSIALLYTAGLALLIILTFVTLVFGKILARYLFITTGYRMLFNPVWKTVRVAFPIVSLMLVFSALYHILPDKRLSFRGVLPGTAVATVLWIAISLGFSFYVNSFNSFSRMYGSIGGIMVLLVWLYWSSVIILLGGEINAVLSRKENL